MNAFNLPVVAYSGANDGQKQAADAMAAAMAAEGLTLEHVIGPNTGHSYEAGARQQIQDRLDQFASRGRNPVPKEVRFTTWTLRYSRMFWIALEGVEQHWQRARVRAAIEGEEFGPTTAGVTAMRVVFDKGLAPFAAGARPRLQIDGTTLDLPAVTRDRSLEAGLVKVNGSWKVGSLPAGLRKMPGLQGPIDDAFMDSFVFVRPERQTAVGCAGAWAQQQADYAISEWTHFFRGEPRVKKDADVTDADIAASNLVLFGDPSSNAVYKRIAARLPIQWRADGVQVGQEKFSADHAPVFVFPNPLNPRRYVVINSGFTFHDQANNAMQTPKLPGLGRRRHHQAWQQLSLSATVRGRARLLRRIVEVARGRSPDRQQVINHWPLLCAGLGIAALSSTAAPVRVPAAALRRRQDVDGVRLRDRGVCRSRRRSSRRRRRGFR